MYIRILGAAHIQKKYFKYGKQTLVKLNKYGKITITRSFLGTKRRINRTN